MYQLSGNKTAIWNTPGYSAIGNSAKNTVKSGASSNMLGQLGSYIGAIKGIAADNTAASAQQAAKLRDWQEQQYAAMREYNSKEAQKNRDWQERMSNTAHQREVRDLIAAGLNPVLSATGGNGASIGSGAVASSGAPSGAMGNVDTSSSSALSGLLSTMLGSLLSLEATRVSAQSNQAVADKYTAMSRLTTEMNNATSKDIASLQSKTALTQSNISAMASRYVADMNLAGTKYASDSSAAASKVSASIHAAAQKYGYDVSAMTQKEVAAFNAQVNRELQEAGFKQEFDIKEAFPNNAWNALGDLVTGMKDDVKNAGLPWGNNIFDYFLNVLPNAAFGRNSAKK